MQPSRTALIHHALGCVERHSLATQVRELPWLSRMIGVPAYAKLEYTQPTGSFKIRGAFAALALRGETTAIAASAGNHALAIAHAGRMLGRDYRICLPSIASPLKREKLANIGAQLLFHGDSLDEAIQHAVGLASTYGWDFVSPFDDERVIAGASTVLIEAAQQVPDVATVLVPTGGGGLLSGCAFAEQYLGRRFDLVAVEPELHATFGGGACIPTAPTLADGLAVVPRLGSRTFEIVGSREPRFESVNEEELAASTLAFLNQESWLVEPSGAAGLAVALRLANQRELKGPLLLLLTGGNVAKSTVAKLFSADVGDRDLAELAGIRGVRTARARAPASVDYGAAAPRAAGPPNATPPNGARSAAEVVADHIMWRGRALLEQVDNFRGYADKRGLALPSRTLAMIASAAQQAMDTAQTLRSAPSMSGSLELRALNSLMAQLTQVPDWRSPAYDQAGVAEFFRLSAQGSANVNYERYGHPAVKEMEEQLRQVMGVRDPAVGCLVTSSGMAAHTVIETWLLRERIGRGSRIALAPYIYFEASEQVTSLPLVDVTRLASYHADDIAEAVLQGGHDVLYVDPLENTADARGVDLLRLLSKLRAGAKKPVTVVVDGTMLPGVLPPLLFGPDIPKGSVSIIYYESASKYLQLGLEHCLAGLILHDNCERAALEKYRRNTGTTIYPGAALGFPRYTRSELVAHMERVSECAASVATLIESDPSCARHLKVVFPTLRSHPDHRFFSQFEYVGGCVNFTFRNLKHNSSDFLNGFIEGVLLQAERKNLPMTKGVSFGFNHIRISAASAIAESEWPFLRLYVSALTEAQCRALAGVFARVCQHLEQESLLHTELEHE